MPRTGWLAVGAAIAALAVGAEDRHLVGILVGAAGLALLIGTVAATRPSRRAPRVGDRDPVDRPAGWFGTGRRSDVGFAGRRWAVDDGRRDRRVPARGPSGGHDPDGVRRRERIPGRRDAAALSSDRTWRPDHRGGTCPAETGQLLWPIPRATRRVGHPRRPFDGGAGAARSIQARCWRVGAAMPASC